MELIPESVILRSLIDTFIPTGVFFVIHDRFFKQVVDKACKVKRESRVVFGFDVINTITLIVVVIRLAIIVVINDLLDFKIYLPFFEEYLALPVYWILTLVPGYCKSCVKEFNYINIGNALLVVSCFWQIIVQTILSKFLLNCPGYRVLIKLNLATIYAYLISASLLIVLHFIVSVIFVN